MTDFKIVDRSHIPQRTGRGHEASELSLALVHGDVVFIPAPAGLQAPPAVMNLYAKQSYVRNRGMRPRQRRGVEDGVEGLFLWAERNGTE